MDGALWGKGELMSDLISREALCKYALNQKDKSITPNDIMRFPPAQPKKRTEERTETHACDLISRHAAIDAMGKAEWAKERLRELPSAQPEVLACGEGELIAQPEIVRCKDCTFYRSDGCFFSTAEIEEDGFCSWAERRTDET